MNVWIIGEENHGILGVAKSKKLAIQQLIETEWITEGTEFFNESTNNWCSIKELLGIHWKEKILEKDSDFFDGSFYFTPYELIE